MSYREPDQNEYANISYAPETEFKTGIAIGSVSGWPGILMESQELPFKEVEFKQLYTAGHTESNVAAGQLPSQTIELKNTYRGRLNWIMQNRNLMEQIFGKLTTTTNTPTSYNTHVYNTGRADCMPLPSFTLAGWIDKDGDGYVEDIDKSMRFEGCKISSTTWTFNEGEELTVESEVAACSQSDQTAFPGALNEITTRPYQFTDGTLTVFGAVYARVKSGSITLGYNLEEKWYTNADPYDLKEKRAEITASLTLVMSGDDLWDLMNADPIASTVLQIDFVRTAAQDTFQLKSLKAYPNIKPAFGGGEGEVEVTVDFVLNDLVGTFIDATATDMIWGS